MFNWVLKKISTSWQQKRFFNSVQKNYLIDKCIKIQNIVTDPGDVLYSKVKCFKERRNKARFYCSSLQLQGSDVFLKRILEIAVGFYKSIKL